VTAELVVCSTEVADALAAARPVVALETTIVAHGFPAGEGLAVGRECEQRVRDCGAVPATVAVLDRALRVGLDDEQLERIATAGADARKVSPRDLATCIVDGALGATTVAATLAACGLAGLRFLATGGIGGIHRGYGTRPDISADLAELARTRAVVVCSGVKSLLDVPATVEAMETLGVPVAGFGTDTVPLFYAAGGGPPVPMRADTPAAVAEIAHTHWALGRETAVVVLRPPAPELDVTALVEDAVTRAREEGVEGQAVTPYVLAYLHEHSAGETLAVNRRLAADNAALAAQIASVYPRER
jgi:pseudouridine-5'-phosphate glycosidase